MPEFAGPRDVKFNRGLVADPEAFAREASAASWLFLCGEEFAAMDGGISYAGVQAAVPESMNIVSDPPRVMDMDLARQHIAALDSLPRPTLVTCRVGPRSSAVRAFAVGDFEVSPARLQSPRYIDRSLPSLPWWSSGLAVGILWGAR